MLWMVFCGVFIVSGWFADGLYWRYFPTIKGVDMISLTLCFLLAYLALCLTPVYINVREDVAWSKLRKEENICTKV